ncbi:MAG: hypothetical protein H7A47_06005 [Verrucomicrobiales bacterium]|nr:hypothetical protein [Verrucomicrobiales bacterium]
MTPRDWEAKSLDRPIRTPGQLLVEGRTPEMFFREMITALDLEAALQVRTFGDIGKDNLQTYLEIFTQKAAFKERVVRLGIVRDAETNGAGPAFQSVQGALQQAHLPAPSVMAAVEGAPLAVGVFILPDCRNPGMLETLCLSAVEGESDGAAVRSCVEGFFACLGRLRLTPSNRTKAWLAACLLARDVLDPQLGRAAQKGVIRWEAPAFDGLKAFLGRLAGPQAIPPK